MKTSQRQKNDRQTGLVPPEARLSEKIGRERSQLDAQIFMRARPDALSAERAVRVLLQLAGKQKGRTPSRRSASLNTLLGFAASANVRRLSPQFQWAKQSVYAANPTN